MFYFNGMKVIINDMLTKGTRQKKTHKAKRINKKWRKKYGYVSIPDKQIYLFDNTIIGHSATIKRLTQNIPKGSVKHVIS